jgi:Tfp pilus assembly protein PilV
MNISKNLQSGISLIEIIIAIAVFTMIVMGTMSVVLGSFSMSRQAEEGSKAGLLAQEGMEAVNSLKNQNWNNVTNGAHGITKTGGTWTFTGTSDTTEKYTRVITVSDVFRDGSGNIVTLGGTIAPETKKVSVIVSWNFGGTRHDGVVINQYVTRWQVGKNNVQPTPTNAPAATPIPANCAAHCALSSQTGSCTKPHQCSGTKVGKMFNCTSSNICCCQ